jgi:hypothetical protein
MREEAKMTTAVFVAAYTIIATAVGMAYFTHRRWDAFFDAHAIHGEAREALTLHLVFGAAALGSAWPVGVIFLLYCLLGPRTDTTPERARKRAPLL